MDIRRNRGSLLPERWILEKISCHDNKYGKKKSVIYNPSERRHDQSWEKNRNFYRRLLRKSNLKIELKTKYNTYVPGLLGALETKFLLSFSLHLQYMDALPIHFLMGWSLRVFTLLM
jgi:hypothetical protein